MQDFDFAIIGAGIAGVSVAYHLAPPHRAKVIILEREHVPAYHTTGRSAALHSETYGSASIRAITVASGRFYRQPPPGFADHPLLTPRGALIAGHAGQEADLKKAAAEYARLVPSVRWLDPDETLRLQPLLKPEAAAGGAVFEPEADDMDVAAIHGGFLKGARAAGAVLRLNAEVAGARSQGRALERHAARRRDDHAPPTSSTPSGAWADVLGGLAGCAPIGLVPKRRTAFTFDAPQGLDLGRLPMVIDFDESFYFKPEVGQFLGSLADETPSPPCDAQPEEIDVATAVDRIETASTLDNPPHQEQVGRPAQLRRTTRTSSPATTRKIEGFFWLAGQGGYGIQTGYGRRPARRRAGAGQGPAGRSRRARRHRGRALPRPLHAAVIERSRRHRQALTSR